ncbi:MAG: manganese efflux pump MntP family protein [Elusimicrobiota bacterium]|jgi:putative Mn2+ efflux pump MntP
MDILTVLGISLGLSMDAFAVSVTSGIAIKSLRVAHAFRIAFVFGLFQAVMPVLGWLAGLSMRGFIQGVDHWIAFGLLLFVGGKMIWEAYSRGGEEVVDPLDAGVLLMLAVATSIDALAVGISFSFLKVSIALPVIVIGLVTFGMCFAGVLIGKKVGHLFERKIEVAGGVILIAIGVKILIEHLGN